MADEIEERPAGPIAGMNGRQKRAFLVAAILVLGAGIAVKFLGKQSAASGGIATDAGGVSAPAPTSVYNSYYTSGTPAAPGSTGGTTGGSAGGSTGGGTILPIRPRNPIDPVGTGTTGLRTGGGIGPAGIHTRNPTDLLGSGPNGLIRAPIVQPLHPTNPTDPVSVAPIPAGSDPAHYSLIG